MEKEREEHASGVTAGDSRWRCGMLFKEDPTNNRRSRNAKACIFFYALNFLNSHD
jgi:hypothetical protein